ncbi:class I SAM-dependent methyltransferase [Histidinibacterium aquaticum]|uniref:Methyltransferase domain-containing protein n=1 Tax=Histidinibacterium aquaticum TaxID=2613962 RepID=A0A5J5GH47_9RHOB|nr:class I SAM-dependent methyltransferase [Histidinibacterium aquaticum]KAA9007063.1 methyltransferase domain-containing protein [Histidinibacterium aquaticum]
MTDERTLAFYADAATRYADKFGRDDASPELSAFMDRLPPAARVLDLGCGPGRASAAMAVAGHRPDPVDASPEMVGIARDTLGLPARLGTFDDDYGEESYDGVWAAYSLLHAPRAHIPGHIAQLARALRPGGPLYLGLKLGEGEARDSLGRHYAYVTEPELTDWIAAAGLTLADSRTTTRRGCAGTDDPCIDLLAVKSDA